MNEIMNTVESNETKALSVKEAADYINESPGVVRNWLRELKSFIPTIIGNHGYRYFDEEGIDMLIKVQKLRTEENLSLSQIAEKLSSSEQPSIPPQSDTTEKIQQDIQNIKEKLELQVNFNQVLVQQLKKQQEHIDEQQQFIQHQKEHISALLDNSSEKSMNSSMTSQPAHDESSSNKPAFLRLFSFR
ncbi:MerR family transcriptional regulator [Niallia sp. 01092]|uniref:MerR family transcriptional regulator n=1 Tax=unclassified Niallia TaxID=2837522 RepID=UPI003FCF7537